MPRQYSQTNSDPALEILRSRGLLSAEVIEQLSDEQSRTGRSILGILKSRALLEDDQLAQVIAAACNVEFIDLRGDMIDPVAAHLVSFDFARQHCLVPVRIEKNKLFVAMSSPLDLAARDLISTRTGYEVIPLGAEERAIGRAITEQFTIESVTRQDIVSMRLKGSSDSEAQDRQPGRKHSRPVDTPIVRLVDSIFAGAVDCRASDIHIEPQRPDVRVRYRVDGILLEALQVPVSAYNELLSHIKILAEMDISERRMPQDGHIDYWHNDHQYDMRVSTMPAAGGEKVVVRVLDSTRGLLKLEQVATCPEDYARLESLIKNPYGMILLTGPTGSGKTTTLYSLIQTLNSPERNIVTVEDPVEYRLNGITQIQVRPEIGRTFATSLRSILRQDPDVILVGEIRDTETAEIAVSAALTGHLVLSTMHTNDAAGAISRLLSLGLCPFQSASAILGIVAQRLIRRVCTRCREIYQPSAEQIAALGPSASETESALTEYDSRLNEAAFYTAIGCEHCHNTGYHGREGVYEILSMTPPLKAMVVDRATDEQINSCAVADGMKTLRMRGIEKILDGTTTIQEVLRVINMRQQ